MWHQCDFHRIQIGQTFESNAEGKILFKGLIPGCSAQFEPRHDEFHTFRKSLSLNYELRKRNRATTVPKYEMLRESSYDRMLQRAKLTLPDTSNLSDKEAISTLTHSYDRAAERMNNRYSDATGTLEELVSFIRLPKVFFRNAIFERVLSTTDRDAKSEGLHWLLRNHGGKSGEFPSNATNENVTSILVEELCSHPGIGNALSSIRSWHPNPEMALQKIAAKHANEETKARALIQLTYYLSTRTSRLRKVPNDIAGRQEKARQGLVRLRDSYGEQTIDDDGKTAEAFAKRELAWLDSFGIGGTPPDFTGNTVQDNKIVTLNEFRGSIVVLHFWNSKAQNDFAELVELLDSHPQVQLPGIAYGDQNAAKEKLSKLELPWLNLWDCHQGLVHRSGAIFEDRSGINWGDEKLNRWASWSPILIDSSGTICGVNLRGSKLAEAVADLVAQAQ